jgi:aspartyl-tRNA(Asn)/glutamyl-tRNA(Gln) amidotransferase subunit A
VKTIQVPDPTTVVDASQVLVACESATIHARVLRERPHELQPVVRGRLEVGLHISAHDYLQAARLRARAARAFIQDVFAEVDLLMAPAIPEPALPWAVAKAGTVDDVIQRMRRFSRLTRPFNGLGLPALALPCGTSPDGRPLAFQIVGRPFDEVSVLRLGRACERETGWTESRPLIV